MSSRCPIPDHAELEFAQQARTGRVHILPYRPAPWEDGDAPFMLASPIPSRPEGTSSDAFVDALLGLVTVLCGYKGYTAPGGRLEHLGREHFGDDALCIRCVRALGDQQWRAFAF